MGIPLLLCESIDLTYTGLTCRPNGTRPERSGSGGDKRANRDAGVYQQSPYARNIADNVRHTIMIH